MDYTLFGSSFLCWAFIALAITLIMFMPSGKKRVTVNDVLKEKFADGTLSVAEYEERKSILSRELESTTKKNKWF